MRGMSLDEAVGIAEGMFRGICGYGLIRVCNLSLVLLYMSERTSSFSHDGYIVLHYRIAT